MPLIRDQFRKEKENQWQIENKVENEAIRTTEEEAEYIRNILKVVSAKYRDQIAAAGFDIPDELKIRIRSEIIEQCRNLPVDHEVRKRIERTSMANIVGLGAITPYLDDPDVTEIVVQHWDNIVIERKGIVESVDAAFMSEEHLRNIIGRIVQPVGRAINIQSPMVDARLMDGSRVNATIPPVTPDGATLTIRKFSKHALTGEDYLKRGSLDERMLEFLAKCVEGRTSIICSGGTNTGKTTLLNMLSNYIPDEELIVTVEDSCELNLNQKNIRRMETRGVSQVGQGEVMNAVTIKDLVKNALRMRPDRLIVGEIRDQTIVDMMSAMSTGHEGSMSTVHANSPRNLVESRMPILYGMDSATSFSAEAQAIQITEALQLIVQLEHLKSGKRVITNITHVAGLDDRNHVDLKDIFIYDKLEERFRATGYVPESVLEKLQMHGINMPVTLFNPD